MAENLNEIGHHPPPPTWYLTRRWSFGVGAPVGPGWEGQPYFDTSSGDTYIYESGTWVLKSGGGGGGSGDANWSSVAGAYGAGNQPPALSTTRGIGYNQDDQSVHYWWSGAWH